MLFETDVEFFQLDDETLDKENQWACNCCYGKLITNNEITFHTLQATLYRVCARSVLRMKMLPNGFFQFFFQNKVGRQGIRKKSPWHLENYYLQLALGSVDILPKDSDFEWFDGWVKIWEIKDYFVTEVVAQNQLQMCGISIVQLKDLNQDGDQFFRVKMKINTIRPLKHTLYYC